MSRVPRDGCAVEAVAVAALLQSFVHEWNRERPPTDGSFTSSTDRVDAVRPYEYLAQETGIKPRTLERYASIPPRQSHLELRVADRIVQAVGLPQAFHDGTLNVVPNPSARASARASCCGGSSLTGVA